MVGYYLYLLKFGKTAAINQSDLAKAFRIVNRINKPLLRYSSFFTNQEDIYVTYGDYTDFHLTSDFSKHFFIFCDLKQRFQSQQVLVSYERFLSTL